MNKVVDRCATCEETLHRESVIVACEGKLYCSWKCAGNNRELGEEVIGKDIGIKED